MAKFYGKAESAANDIISAFQAGTVPPARNARFWSYINGGPVKITLRPGQRLSWSTGWPTDEGWSAEGSTWEHCGDHVTAEHSSEGRDCDGRHGHYSDVWCPLDQLAAGNHPHCSTDADRELYAGIQWAAWQQESASQYDQFAELAGY